MPTRIRETESWGRAGAAALAAACMAASGGLGCSRISELSGSASASPVAVSAGPPSVPDGTVAARGRLEPRDGLIVIAGPSEMAVVVQRLHVDKGDRVKRGQVIAVLDQETLRRAALERARAELTNAEAEMARARRLKEGHAVADSRLDQLEMQLRVAHADVLSAQTALERQYVRAPFDAQVIEILAREGERVTAGIAEIGRTDRMYAVAEVFETDIGRVKLGQRAEVASPALARTLEGTVDRIGRKVGKLDAIGADPAARTDARVIEVEVRLDDSEPAAALTNLQVEVTLLP